MGRAVRRIGGAIKGVARGAMGLAKGVAGAALNSTPLGSVMNMAMGLSKDNKMSLINTLTGSLNQGKG